MQDPVLLFRDWERQPGRWARIPLVRERLSTGSLVCPRGIAHTSSLGLLVADSLSNRVGMGLSPFLCQGSWARVQGDARHDGRVIGR